MMLIRPKDKQTLLNIFSMVESPFEVWAYGSRVNGTAHEGSDLDLVVRMQTEQKMESDIFFGLKEKIQQSNIPIIVELFDWARLPESFHRNILASHEVFYSNCEILLHEPNTPNQRKHGSPND